MTKASLPRATSTISARWSAAAVNWQAKIDQLTDRALVAAWPIDRIDPVLRALFRAAGAEIVDTGTPPKVAITEYVDVAKAFFPDGKEPKFVNAVLDHMAREASPRRSDARGPDLCKGAAHAPSFLACPVGRPLMATAQTYTDHWQLLPSTARGPKPGPRCGSTRTMFWRGALQPLVGDQSATCPLSLGDPQHPHGLRQAGEEQAFSTR